MWPFARVPVADTIERGARGEIYLRCESGDMIAVFRDSEGGIVIQVPAPRRGMPRAVLADDEARALVAALSRLVDDAG